MLVKTSLKSAVREGQDNGNRYYSISSYHVNVSENLNSGDPMVQAAIKRDSDKFKKITDLSERLKAL